MKQFYSNFLSVLIILSFISFSTEATTYYVSTSGNNSKSGNSIINAWNTIDKVNSKNFLPGDIILFEGGKTFSGRMFFDQDDAGSAAAPIVIGSYGTGRATINSDKTFGFYAYNTGGIKVNNLIFQGSGRTINEDAGISFYNDLENKILEFIEIDNVEVFGYKVAGIIFGTDLQTNGYANVKITNSSVHDNANVGITSYSGGKPTHKNVYIGNTKVFNNSGIADYTSSHTGSGIMLAGIDGALIEYCEAYNNGWLNAWTVGGPVGIWGYICNNLVIQHNESHHNRTGTNKDGGGFDLDGGCTNSIMQYNYSHDNDGAGYLLAQYSGAPEMKNLIIRYNISENDGRKNGNAGILLWATNSNGGIQNADIYNNTIYLSPASNGTPTAVFVSTGYITNTKIRNNIIQTTGGLQVVRSLTNTGVRFEGNDYWSSGDAFKIYWNGTTYSDLAKWRQVTGQEKLNNEPVGFNEDPQLTEPGKGVTIGDPNQLPDLFGYKLQSTSGLIGKGLNLTSNFGINVGEVDFWRNKINLQENFSIGAHQIVQSIAAKTAQTITFPEIKDLVYGVAPVALEASSSAGLKVSYKIVSGPATLSQNILTLTGTGLVTVEATQSGDDTYAPAPARTQTFTVNKATQQITFATLSDKILGTAPFALEASASSGLPVSFEVTSGPATITNNILSLTGTGSVTIAAKQSGSDLFLPAQPIVHSFAVNNLVLNQTITFPSISNKVYGEEFTLQATASSGLPVNFKIVSGPATINENRLKITGTGTVKVEASQAGNSTYTAAPGVNQSFTVNKAEQNISFASLANKTLGDESISLVASATSGLPVSFAVVSGPATILNNVITLTGTGLVYIQASQAGNTNYLAAANVNQSFTVNSPAKQDQTITFAALEDKTFGDAPVSLNASASSGLPVAFQVLSGPATLSGNILTLNGVGTVTVRSTQAGNNAYHPAAFLDYSFNVNQANQTIDMARLGDKTFGDAPFKVSGNASSGLPVSFSIVSGPATISGSIITITGAGSIIVRASQSGNNNYVAAATEQSITVNKATQSISFASITDKTLDNAALTLTASASSGLPVIFSVVSGPATLSGNSVILTGVGIVVVSATQAGNDNFSAATPVERTFRVLTTPKQDQTITFTAIPNKTFGNAPFAIGATASSGLPVNYNILSGPATIAGNTITITGAGTVVVEAVQNGNDTYSAAPAFTRSFMVNKASQTILFAALPNKNYNQEPIILNATAGSGLPVSFSVVSGPATIINNSLTLTGIGMVVVGATQEGNNNYLAAVNVDRSFSVGKAQQTISFAALTNKTYGDAAFDLEGTATSGLAVSFRVKSGPATLAGNKLAISNVGTVEIEASQTGNNFYAAAPVVAHSFTVNKASQVISFGELANKQVGNVPFALTATSTNTTEPVTFTSSNSNIISVAQTNGKWMATVIGAGTVTITASQTGNNKFLAATPIARSLVVQAVPAVTNEIPAVVADKLKIVAVNPDKNTGMDYTPWLNDDLTTAIKKVWHPKNNKWVNVTLQLEHRSKVNKISLYDTEGVFTDKPVEIYALNGKKTTFIGLFKGEEYNKWVDILLKEPLVADAIIIRKYANYIPHKINVYGKIMPNTEVNNLTANKPKVTLGKSVWSAFPNPTVGKVQVEIDPQLEGPITITLLGPTGNIIKHLTVQKNTSNITQTLSLENQKNGLYFLHLRAKGVWEVKKIYKQ